MKRITAMLLMICLCLMGQSVLAEEKVGKIAVAQEPTKMDYWVGEEFSAEGGVLLVTYRDKTTAEIPMTDENVKLPNVKTNTPGRKAVKVTYGGKNVTFYINVAEKGAEVTFERKNYQTFSDVNRPEVFIDANKNGVYDNKECFDDENGNNRWDADVGASGQGGARDVVVYRVTVAYDELVPLSRFVGLDPKRRFSAVTTLMNQPFATQADRPVKQICPK